VLQRHSLYIQPIITLDYQRRAGNKRFGYHELKQPFGNLLMIQVGKELLEFFDQFYSTVLVWHGD